MVPCFDDLFTEGRAHQRFNTSVFRPHSVCVRIFLDTVDVFDDLRLDGAPIATPSQVHQVGVALVPDVLERSLELQVG